MAKAPLTTRIALEGGEEVIKMLRAMGAEGQAAADKLEKAFKDVGIGKSVEGNVAKLRSAFNKIQSAGSTLGKSFQNVGQSFDKLGQAAGRTRNRVLLFTAALTGAAYGVNRFISSGLNALGQLQDLSESLNISAENLQGLGLAAATVGADAGDLTKGIVGINDALKELRDASKAGIGEGLGKSMSRVVTQSGKVINIYRGVEGAGAKLEKSLLQIPDANGKLLNVYLDTADKSKDTTTELSDKAQALVKIFKAMGVTLSKDMSDLDVLKVMARYFSQAKDQGELLGLAVDVFGAKLGPKMVRLLKQGEDALDGYKNTLKGIGVLVTDEQTAAADTAGDKLTVLGTVYESFRNKIAAQFAPAITKAADTILAFLTRNGASISAFIEKVGVAVTTVSERLFENGDKIGTFFTDLGTSISSLVDDIILLASGGDQSQVKNQWLITLRDGVAAAGEAIRYVFFDLIPTAFGKILEYSEPVAKFINSIFGTNLSAEGVVIAAVVLQMAGAFGLLFSALSAIGTVVIAVGTIIGLFGAIPAAIITALIGAAAAIYIFWDEIVAAAKITGEFIFGAFQIAASKITDAWNAAIEFVRDLWKGTIDFIVGTFDSLMSKIRSLMSLIRSAISLAKSLAKSAVSGGGAKREYATGGYIRGPGSGTSDSIPAWLSNGEFVIRASAVRKYGAELFAALNGMRLSPNAVGRFAMGGLVSLPAMPAAALPAAAGPTSSLTLVLDNQQFSGLSGSVDTIAKLERAIKMKRVRSTGRANPYER